MLQELLWGLGVIETGLGRLVVGAIECSPTTTISSIPNVLNTSSERYVCALDGRYKKCTLIGNRVPERVRMDSEIWTEREMMGRRFAPHTIPRTSF
jgi:hypothetical protein